MCFDDRAYGTKGSNYAIDFLGAGKLAIPFITASEVGAGKVGFSARYEACVSCGFDASVGLAVVYAGSR